MKKAIAHKKLEKSVIGLYKRPYERTNYEYWKVAIKGDKWYIPIIFVKNSKREANVALRTATQALAYSARTRDLNIKRAISAGMNYKSPAPEPALEGGVRVVSAKTK